MKQYIHFSFTISFFFSIALLSGNLIAQECDMGKCSTSNLFCHSSGACCLSVGVGNPKSFGVNAPVHAPVSQVGNYNCHQFTKAYLHGNLSGTPTLSCTSHPNLCPCNFNAGEFRSNVEFIPVSYEFQADAAYYPCDHSAVRLGTFQYMSKDGYGGDLYVHSLMQYSFGVNSCYPVNYYAFVGNIQRSFSGNIFHTPSQFSLRSKQGVTYEWCAEPANLVSISNPTSANPTISPIGSGNVVISVTVTGAGGVAKTQCVNLVIPSECGNSTISGTVSFSNYSTSLQDYNSIFNRNSIVSVSSPQATRYEWEKTSGTGSYSTSANGHQSYLNMRSGQHLAFTIRSFNANNLCLGSRNVFFQCTTTGWNWFRNQNPSHAEAIKQNDVEKQSTDHSFPELAPPTTSGVAVTNIYPNPARNMVNIESHHLINSIQLFNELGILVREEKIDNQSNALLNVSNLSAGVYFIKIMSPDHSTTLNKILIY